MGKLLLLCGLGVMLCAIPASAIYEDFATTGDQYTLSGNQTVTAGHVDGVYAWDYSVALLDGDYPASAANPVQITATWNANGDGGTWAMPVVGFGSDGNAGGGHVNGFMVNFLPNYSGGHGQNSFMVINGTDGWNDVVWEAFYDSNGDLQDHFPGGFDSSADYQTVVTDSGSSVDYWVQLASDPTIKTPTTTVDLTGWTRFGDKVYTHAIAGAMYVDGVNIEIIPEPATICLLGVGALSLIRRKRA